MEFEWKFSRGTSSGKKTVIASFLFLFLCLCHNTWWKEMTDAFASLQVPSIIYKSLELNIRGEDACTSWFDLI